MTNWAKYEKKFNDNWLKDPLFVKWLLKASDPNKAYCKLCKSELRAHRFDLVRHKDSAKHLKNAAAIAVHPTINKVFPAATSINQKNLITKIELKLAVHTACHSSISVIDHLSEIIKDQFQTFNSNKKPDQSLRIHRTKCTALLTRVIEPSLLQQQIKDINDVQFSLILDESTDVSCQKHLCICIRYFNIRKKCIVSQYLGLIPVVETSANDLYEALNNYFKKINLNLLNCFAIATDGGSNLCGIRHSLFTLMKEKKENLMLFKCICHSIHLVCSHASEELPSNVDYMLRETFNWFKRSALRKKKYLDIYNTLNDGGDPLQLVQLSGTRWLARGQAVARILDQWDSLKLHFDVAASEKHQDRYTAKELQQMYNDPANLLYFTFLSPILSEFNSINLLFQKEHADHFTILQELEQFTLALLRRILFPASVSLSVNLSFQSIYLPLNRVDFGYKFTKLIEDLLSKTDISKSTINDVKLRCQSFLIKACKELIVRTSDNTKILKKIQYFSPKVCLKTDRPSFAELPLDLLGKNVDLNIVEMQWRKLIDYDFKSEFGESVISQGSLFWSKLMELKDAEENLLFKELATLALTAYSLPISNATVERVFSRVTATKNKLRNRMNLPLLSSIIRIKMSLDEDGICCTQFEPKEKEEEELLQQMLD
ncbi:zinc finger protein 862-like [Microplitis demolitor]|uniref:zinc finger protein 862-like n=1 Tax=Microplitis demolitor TaxID=69319 RepID=UPI00235B6755|nr:zinc finger protein 862-like [Microplitis demolitor]XP_053598633.1 zinc finger protein 862-like [Microplitis demolitor]